MFKLQILLWCHQIQNFGSCKYLCSTGVHCFSPSPLYFFSSVIPFLLFLHAECKGIKINEKLARYKSIVSFTLQCWFAFNAGVPLYKIDHRRKTCLEVLTLDHFKRHLSQLTNPLYPLSKSFQVLYSTPIVSPMSCPCLCGLQSEESSQLRHTKTRHSTVLLWECSVLQNMLTQLKFDSAKQ